VSKEVHPKIIGKGGAQIRKIRDETDTKIDFPRENSDSDVITITGKKENVEKAKNMIETIEKETVCFCLLLLAATNMRSPCRLCMLRERLDCNFSNLSLRTVGTVIS